MCVNNSHMSSHTVWVLRTYLVNPPYAVIENEAVGVVQALLCGFNLAEASGSALEFTFWDIQTISR